MFWVVARALLVARVFWVVARALLGGCYVVARLFWVVARRLLGCSGWLLGCC